MAIKSMNSLVYFSDNNLPINTPCTPDFKAFIDNALLYVDEAADYLGVPIDDFFNTSVYQQRLSEIDMKASLSIGLGDNIFELVIVFSAADSTNPNLNLKKEFNLLGIHINDNIQYDFHISEDELYLSEVLTRFDPKNGQWDKSVNDIAKDLTDIIQNIFNEDVFTEDILNLIKL